MKGLSRRHFIVGSAAGAAGVYPRLSSARRVSANDRVSVAVVGLGGMGRGHVDRLLAAPGAVCVALCDIDQSMLDREQEKVLQATGARPRGVKDFRHVLDDTSVDAVVVATPHHWHVHMAIPALRAGKDVYLEKPGSHVFREGRLLVEAAQETNRIVQHGTQMRSSQVTARAREVLDSGVIGEIKMSKAWNLQQHRHRQPVPDAPEPPGVDYDLWLGPAPQRPFNPNRFHGNWNWYRDYGNGDIGGDGIHDLDLAHFGLSPETHPVRITEHGSSVHLEGVEREFPDNMMVAYHFREGKVLLYEDRAWTPYGSHGVDSGNAFYGTEGFMVFSRRGFFQVYLGRKEERGPGMRGDRGDRGHPQHLLNFLDCVRTRKQPTAPALQAHRSCALVHLGEAAYRAGKVLELDPESETITNDSDANRFLTKDYREPWSL